MRTRLEIPVRHPVTVGFTCTEDGTEIHKGTPCVWHAIDEAGDIIVWTGHFTVTVVAEAAPYIDAVLADYVAYWHEFDFPDLDDGPTAWATAASAFFDFLVVDAGDPLRKGLLDLLVRPDWLDGWIGEFVHEYAAEIDRLDTVLADREWAW